MTLGQMLYFALCVTAWLAFAIGLAYSSWWSSRGRQTRVTEEPHREASRPFADAAE